MVRSIIFLSLASFLFGGVLLCNGIYKKATIYNTTSLVAKKDTTLYLDSALHLASIDVTEEEYPHFINFSLNLNPKDIVFDEDIAYVLSPYFIYSVDISNPYHPIVLSKTNVGEGYPLQGIVKKGTIIITATYKKLYVLDTKDGNLTPLKTIELDENDVRGLQREGDTLYLFTYDNILEYNITDPKNPVAQGTLPFQKSSTLYHYNNYYITNSGIYETNFQQVFSFPSSNIALYGSVLFASYDPDILIYDIQDIAHPKLLGILPGDNKLFIDNNTLYAYGDRIDIYDISNPVQPSFKATAYDFQNFYVYGHYVYEQTLDNTMVLYEINATYPDIGHWKRKKYLNIKDAYAVTLFQDRLYVGDSEDIRIYSLTDPLSPTITSTIAHRAGTIRKIVPTTNFIYVLEDKAFWIYDKNSSSPADIVYPNNNFQDIILDKTRAYLIHDNKLISILDISNPSHIIPLHSIDVGASISSFALDSDTSRLYVATPGYGVAIYSLDGKKVANLAYKSAYRVKLLGNFLFVTDIQEGIDIYNTISLQKIGHLPIIAKRTPMYVADEALYKDDLVIFNRGSYALQMDLNTTVQCFEALQSTIHPLTIQRGWNLVAFGKYTPYSTKTLLQQIPNATIWYYVRSKQQLGAYTYYGGKWQGISNNEQIQQQLQQKSIYPPNFIEKYHAFWLYNGSGQVQTIDPLATQYLDSKQMDTFYTNRYALPTIWQDWSLISSQAKEINATRFIHNIQTPALIWKFDTLKGWSAISNDTNLTNILHHYSIPVLDSIHHFEGFWIHLQKDENLSL